MIEVPADALVIGLGGNIGDDAAIIDRFGRAREALGSLGEVRAAALYRSAPIGVPQQPFLNSAVRVRMADATAAEIIETVLEIERLLGRDRNVEIRGGPRAIDLDVLLWGARQVRWDGPPALEVPHPRLAERRFVLQPLIDLLGEAVTIPGTALTIAELERRVRAQSVERVAAAW
ncbi:MAG: 2-amino-4-hydroxy-6-hydroxymethyldihydropteridin epyrophosphokinae [Myxococcales bacterium]|nr:2-amino-4-hydroxy-6-hydroxymethyldihydropteridin epyrophosphokinae [Myxococcales bacterium]